MEEELPATRLSQNKKSRGIRAKRDDAKTNTLGVNVWHAGASISISAHVQSTRRVPTRG
jgi:hypothetical protein